MMRRIFSVAAILLSQSLTLSAQQKTSVQIIIRDSITGHIMPVMMCITNLETNTVHIPPSGDTAPPPTFPSPFFTGISYSPDLNWIGPVRRMNGPGGINHQRTYVYGTTPSVPHWEASIGYQVSGNVKVSLAKGSWRIDIRRGMEYIPVSHELKVEDSSPITLNFKMKRWVDLPSKGWYSGDVHVHHTLDKPSDTAYLFALARAEDVHVMNMLEMGDRVSTHFKSPKYGIKARMVKDNYALAIGQEEPRSDYGHVIGLNIDTLARDTSRYHHYDVVFDKIHQSKRALAGYAHFAYGGEGVIEGMALYAPFGHIDFVELMQNTKLNRQLYYDYLNMGFRISATSGSDFPWGSVPGDGRTFVYTSRDFTLDAWFEGLKGGKTFVSNGPVLMLQAGGAIPGVEIKKKKGESIKVAATVYCHPAIGKLKKLEIISSAGTLAQVDLSGRDSATFEMDYNLVANDWIAAYALCDNEAVAHTSPVYISVGSKGVGNPAQVAKLLSKQIEIVNGVKRQELKKTVPDQGVLKRADNALKYYKNMQKKATK